MSRRIMVICLSRKANFYSFDKEQHLPSSVLISEPCSANGDQCYPEIK